MNQELREAMHGWARVQIALAKMDGHKIDRRVCRYNDLIECADRYARCGVIYDPAVAWAGLRDAIDACIIGDPMHTGGPVTEVVYDWMLGD